MFLSLVEEYMRSSYGMGREGGPLKRRGEPGPKTGTIWEGRDPECDGAGSASDDRSEGSREPGRRHRAPRKGQAGLGGRTAIDSTALRGAKDGWASLSAARGRDKGSLPIKTD